MSKIYSKNFLCYFCSSLCQKIFGFFFFSFCMSFCFIQEAVLYWNIFTYWKGFKCFHILKSFLKTFKSFSVSYTEKFSKASYFCYFCFTLKLKLLIVYCVFMPYDILVWVVVKFTLFSFIQYIFTELLFFTSHSSGLWGIAVYKTKSLALWCLDSAGCLVEYSVWERGRICSWVEDWGIKDLRVRFQMQLEVVGCWL